MKKHVLLTTVILGLATLASGQWQSITTPDFDPNYTDCNYSFNIAVGSNNTVYWAYSENCAEGGMGQSFYYEIFSSSNYGSSWTSKITNVNIPTYIVEMDFISADTGYFVDVSGTFHNHEFNRTSDGLNNYQYCYYEDELDIRAIEMSSYNDIYLFDEEARVIHLENDTFNLISDLPIELYENYSLKPTITTTPNHHLFIACKSYIDGSYANSLILNSQDGGYNWDTSFISNTITLNDLCFVTDSLGFAVGNEGRILKTQDSGQSWEVMTSDTYSDLLCIDFMDDQTWIAGGSNATLLLSEDSGETWNEIYLPNSNCSIQKVKFPEKDDIVYINGCGFKWASIYDFTAIPTQQTTPEYFDIYPNPAKDHFTIENISNEFRNTTLEIFNLLGEKVFSQSLIHEQENIDCSSFPKGIYFLKVAYEGKNSTQRLVIQ